jgi:hypothetical protein
MAIFDFTYTSYGEFLKFISESGYTFTDYHNFAGVSNPCILRHDIDYDIRKAFEFAKFETKKFTASKQIYATYFVLLTSPFYNVLSHTVIKTLKEMISMGHEIGLHFDETQYLLPPNEMIGCVQKELNILEQILEHPVTVVSMHRPSQTTLRADIGIPGVINSYSQIFFKEFKYISDSRHHWQENVEDIVASKEYKKLQILTHPFWYTEVITSCKDKLFSFISSGSLTRYYGMNDNFKNLDEFVQRNEIE